MKYFLFTVAFMFSSVCAFAQNQNNIWYFGQLAGLDFNSKPPEPLTNGQLNTYEGCASISDKNGQLLFYTDGKTIWNKNHVEMKNGGGLFGHDSSTQSAIITSCPDNDQLFYVFTVGVSEGKINYSIVNISSEGGLGEVTQKNNFLLETATEKLTATKHANGKDIWVIGHKAQSSDFYAWLLTNNGISDSPVISTVGTSERGPSISNIGSVKVSRNSSVLAVTANNTDGGFLEVYKFNAGTGIISDPKKLTGFGKEIPYGIEFSPNGNLLYVSGYSDIDKGKIYQLPISFTTGLITDKATIVASLIGAGALQRASDGKIYLSQRDSRFLHAINLPNLPGGDCGFVTNAVSLKGQIAKLGLPQFNVMSSDELSFLAEDFCVSDVTKFTMATFTGDYDEVIWDFDDPGSGTANISNDKDPVHQFSHNGDFYVKLVVVSDGFSRSFTQKITIIPTVTIKPTILADNAVLCDTGKVNITATGAIGGQRYNWYDESKTLIEQNNGSLKTPSILKTTIFYASITNGECEGELQPIEIQMNKPLITITATDTIINVGESVTLRGGGGGSYNWSPAIYLSNTNSGTTTSTPSSNTTYTLTITNDFGCTATKSIRVILIPAIFIPNTFTPNNDGVNDLWVIKELVGLPNQLQVYNRLGALVYSAKNYDNTWNGTYKNKDLPAGTYYYVINFAKTVRSGYIAIIR